MANSCNPVSQICSCDFIGDVSVPKVCTGPNQTIPPYVFCGDNFSQLCCANTTECQSQIPPIPTSPTTPSAPPTPTNQVFNPYDPVTNETFDTVNPLMIGGGDDIDESEPSQYAAQLSTPGGIISRALTFIFPLAGLILFVLLVWGGFEMLAGSPTKKSMESGKQRITAAVAGFFLLFAAYWIWQIVEVVFGIAIL